MTLFFPKYVFFCLLVCFPTSASSCLTIITESRFPSTPKYLQGKAVSVDRKLSFPTAGLALGFSTVLLFVASFRSFRDKKEEKQTEGEMFSLLCLCFALFPRLYALSISQRGIFFLVSSLSACIFLHHPLPSFCQHTLWSAEPLVI